MTSAAPPPAVMVPVGVLKRSGSSSSGKHRTNKSVMFCDGIRPGSDLTNLDRDFAYKEAHLSKATPIPETGVARRTPALDKETDSYVPKADGKLPPTVTFVKSRTF